MSDALVSRATRQGSLIHSLCQEGDLAKIAACFDGLAAHSSGAILNARERVFGRYTPVHIATANGHFAVLRFLLSKGGNPNCKDGDGLRPLHLAARMGWVDCVGVLLEWGADPLASSPEGRSPRDMTKSKPVERMLRSAGGCGLQELVCVSPYHCILYRMKETQCASIYTYTRALLSKCLGCVHCTIFILFYFLRNSTDVHALHMKLEPHALCNSILHTIYTLRTLACKRSVQINK